MKEPKSAVDLRPITRCNVVYKIASKVLANRLKLNLPQIIYHLQSAFVPSRLISDNTLVATEVVHFMHKLRWTNDRLFFFFFFLKLDISKAYNRLEWTFVKALLSRLEFARAWIDIVLCSLKSVSYSLLVNGEPSGYIIPTRGIRQGCILSSWPKSL